MIHIFFLLITFLFAWPAFAVTSCPSGMVLAKTSASPVLDCVCFGGQRPRMNISSTGSPTALFGSCPDSQTFYPSPFIGGGVASISTGRSQTFIAPQTGIYTIEAWGAQGGQSGTSHVGGKGGYVRGEYSITVGTVLVIFVGQQGENDPFTNAAGGGGGTNVVKALGPPYVGYYLALAVAGGGAGGGTSNGLPGKDASNPGTGSSVFANSSGGSWSSGISTSIVSAGRGICNSVNGLDSSPSCSNGGTKKDCTTGGGDGGYGGGGAATCSSNLPGSGGGFTGGNGSPAQGGSSYLITVDGDPSIWSLAAMNRFSAEGVQTGGGKVVISW